MDYARKLRKLDNPKNTIDFHRKMWDNYDWSQGGEEWTQVAKKARGLDPLKWKQEIINKLMLKYIRKDSIILEIGPGAGRWTTELINIAHRLILADISKTCLKICKKKFKDFSNIEYHYIDKRLDFLEDNSIDYVWSYDVFVHINPADVANYVEDFERILKPGGIAIINHTGALSGYESGYKKEFHLRSEMDEKIMSQVVSNYKMIMLEQNYDIGVAHPGDLVSVFAKTKES